MTRYLSPNNNPADLINLPEPRYESSCPVESAIRSRRSVRDYSGKPLTLGEVSQLLWAAQGITSPQGERAAPSAGALYPLELYVAVGDVENLPQGIYKYHPRRHSLIRIDDADVRAKLSTAALAQSCVRDGAVTILIASVHRRITGTYGRRGIQYIYMEAGHVSQNIHLQAEALNLGTVAVGAFDDRSVKIVMKLAEDEEPLYIMPVGRKR
ncbi:MAG: SagB/ThcOx family dehydrogenase [Candidatus Latescibacteria bacterium]|nr:SagB/ThcOx family dehydrogenase [Candidatus Latescibacterota bacterium]NIO28418.1 SagB/ThcOx family dehydrogenase [Candidatus Latescibacterota bacterium]NIO55967.1 SagB/ThcOx family dehydrogenase [Candidatus Latescibacterota bacterium]NIT01931.1 SagB/ThcOx family dehydrogenase [Candidatus Latescibacterota bacterium]